MSLPPTTAIRLSTISPLTLQFSSSVACRDHVVIKMCVGLMDFNGVLAAAAGMVVEDHAGRRWAAPAPVIAEGRLADACSHAVMDAIVPGLQIGEGQVDKH